MGCASSAALPFLTGRGTQAVNDSSNGETAFELNNKLKGDEVNGIKDVNEMFVSDKMKEVVDSSAVQGVIEGVVNTKNEIVHQIQGAGEAVSNKLSSVVEGVEESVESTFGQITEKIEEVQEKVKSEIHGVGEKISSVTESAEDTAEEKQDEIDELLAELPDENEINKQSRATAEELIEVATEEVKEDEMND